MVMHGLIGYPDELRVVLARCAHVRVYADGAANSNRHECALGGRCDSKPKPKAHVEGQHLGTTSELGRDMNRYYNVPATTSAAQNATLSNAERAERVRHRIAGRTRQAAGSKGRAAA
jgi:hypothetical protein